jgi:phenylpyruvate tautomerase PptA (4-oxalocrotonate tautomerase family)
VPLLHVYVPKGLVAPETRRALGVKMTTTLLEVERIPDNEAARAMSWVLWHEMAEVAWIVPGLDPSTPRCLVEVIAPSGLLDASQKEAAVQRLTADIVAAWSAPDSMEARLRVWVIVRDVPDGSWGVAGFIAPSAVIKSGLSG